MEHFAMQTFSEVFPLFFSSRFKPPYDPFNIARFSTQMIARNEAVVVF